MLRHKIVKWNEGKKTFPYRKANWKSPKWQEEGKNNARHFTALSFVFNEKKVLKQQFGCVANQHAIAMYCMNIQQRFILRERLYKEPVVAEKGREREVMARFSKHTLKRPT